LRSIIRFRQLINGSSSSRIVRDCRDPDRGTRSRGSMANISDIDNCSLLGSLARASGKIARFSFQRLSYSGDNDARGATNYVPRPPAVKIQSDSQAPVFTRAPFVRALGFISPTRPLLHVVSPLSLSLSLPLCHRARL